MSPQLPRQCLRDRCIQDAVPGRSRCADHGGKPWSGKVRDRQYNYNSGEYKRNREIVLRQEPSCHWGFPGCRGRSTTADHLVSLAEGGSNNLENLVGSCWPCNITHGAQLGHLRQKQRREQS
jgi:5-methylcytosine-specific restriction endonuclease McrA